MKIYTVQVGFLQTNCYIIASEKNNAIVIDPGDQLEKITEVIDKHGLTVKFIVLTHAHSDHIGALYDLREKTGANVCIHKADADSIADPERNRYSFIKISNYKPTNADIKLSDGDRLELDEIKFNVMHTPGHTKGSIILIGDGVMFTGDTLFKGQTGRTDLHGGSEKELRESLRRIYAITGDYKILSGHGESSTLEYEKQTNPYLRYAVNEADF